MNDKSSTEQNQKKINLNNSIASVATDGNFIAVNNDGWVSLNFFQIVPGSEQADSVNANVVSSTRVTIEQARQLVDQLNVSIENFDKNKTAKK